MRAPRKRAQDVQVGDAILTCYYPRTWQIVRCVQIHEDEGYRPVMIDTDRDRTWYHREDYVPCRAVESGGIAPAPEV